MKVCSYCDHKRKLTKEHIWPKCIINRMPELEAKYIGNQDKFTSAELVVRDVCAECNNTKLSKLDDYLCFLYDKYFKYYVEEIDNLTFEYNYELLLRVLLKITYNNARTFDKTDSYYREYRKSILNGGIIHENIVIKLDIIKPHLEDDNKIYPKSARCGRIDVGIQSDKFILRLISLNSFYFYIIISVDNLIDSTSVEILENIYSRVPGTLIHPYQDKVTVSSFSDIDTYSAHIDFILRTKKSFNEYSKGKSGN